MQCSSSCQGNLCVLTYRFGLVGVHLRLAAYAPRDSTQPLPLKGALAAAFQKLVSTGQIAHHTVNHTSLVITGTADTWSQVTDVHFVPSY